MIIRWSFKAVILISLIFLNVTGYAQDESLNGLKGFHYGLYFGAFFPADRSASLYDGYGVDTAGNKNIYYRSAMYERMSLLGLDKRYNDQIGPAIGVTSRDQWSFDSTDMAQDMKYSTAFVFGVQLQHGITENEGIILNANFSQLRVTGTFTITVHNNLVNPLLGDSVVYFGIYGEEQRFMLQLGYTRIFGHPDRFNFLAEGGFLMNSVQYLNNRAEINYLQIDLKPFTYNQGVSNDYVPPEYNKLGYGIFLGLGLNMNVSSKYILQLVYNPSYEKINIGWDPAASMQHSLGLRAYFNF